MKILIILETTEDNPLHLQDFLGDAKAAIHDLMKAYNIQGQVTGVKDATDRNT